MINTLKSRINRLLAFVDILNKLLKKLSKKNKLQDKKMNELKQSIIFQKKKTFLRSNGLNITINKDQDLIYFKEIQMHWIFKGG